MTKSHSLVQFCVSRIAPAAAALVFACTGGTALADSAGHNALLAKLNPAYIPTLKAGTTIDKAKAPDILEALSLALQDPANSGITAAHIAEEVFSLGSTGKARADKDKIAGQVLATAAEARNLGSDSAGLSALAAAIFNVNSGNSKAALTISGKSVALAAAIQEADSAAVAGNVGTAVAGVFTGSTTDLSSLLGGIATAMGTSTFSARTELASFVNTLVTAKAGGSAASVVTTAAEKIAAKNAEGAGALFGGLVASGADPSTVANSIITDKKLTKALGAILGDTTSSVSNKAALATALLGASGKAGATNAPYIAQGLIRAGSQADVAGVLGALNSAIKDPAKFAAIAAVGTGDDDAKVSALTQTLANGLDAKGKTALAISILNAFGTNTPEGGDAVVTGLGLTSDAVSFAQGVVGKTKSYAAAGVFAAKAVKTVNGNIAVDTGSLMAKATKAATDIARQVALDDALTGGSTAAAKAAFADTLADTNNGKFTLNVAVGVSMAAASSDPSTAGTITASAVAHAGLSDKSSLAKVATIAGAVASAVDEEAASFVGLELAAKMDGVPSTAKPIKVSSATTVATALAKAIQAKPGVLTANRMDELGEVAAALTANVLGKSGSDKNEAKLITGIGSAILKVLSKTAVLSGNPNSVAEAALVAKTQTRLADLWEARDIAGSIAQTIFSLGSQSQIASLLTSGTLETAFTKLAGKKGSATATAVHDAFQDVINGNGAAKFETGAVSDKETDTKNG